MSCRIRGTSARRYAREISVAPKSASAAENASARIVNGPVDPDMNSTAVAASLMTMATSGRAPRVSVAEALAVAFDEAAEDAVARHVPRP